ncbi:hypothetical protein D5S17_32980 [Pseudonocardiaceae bacterium YIM PH 21723]|nr:hypothetical protein D5S17_32980 [Pseudonocardiaceae bacterium YIM PH 21723]
MTDREAFFGRIVENLDPRYRIADLDKAAGTFDLCDEERKVPVSLPLDLLAEYREQLNGSTLPDFPESPEEARDQARLMFIRIWIEELFEADVLRTVREIRLARAADGRLSLVRRRGPVQRPFPRAETDGAYWSAD